MRNVLIAAGLAAAMATAPSIASAQSDCHNRRVTGTVLGAVGGGLLGNVVASRGVKTEGALLGAGVGAVVGNQVAKCKRSRSYARTRTYAPRSTAASSNYRYASNTPVCRYENRPYYDERGRLVYAPTQVCR